jgi:sugar phosphate isomerase/epimerase
MPKTTDPRFAVDLFAYWHADAWGVADVAELTALGRTEPRTLWDRLLAKLRESGVHAIEVTFAPFDWRTATAAYGGLKELRDALDEHGLSICGGYLPQLEHPDALAGGGRVDLFAEAAAYAEFLAQMGATSLIGSLPHRSTRGSRTARVVDLELAQRLSEPLHEVGRIAYDAGVSFGLHTESHSQLWLERDVDLFMLATDPFYVGLCPDAAHLVLGGGDPVAVVERYTNRLVSAHWKDATGPMSWDVPIDAAVHTAHRELCRVPGQGVVDWTGWADVMARAGLTEPVLLEVDAVPTPVEDIRSAIEYLTPLLRARG